MRRSPWECTMHSDGCRKCYRTSKLEVMFGSLVSLVALGFMTIPLGLVKIPKVSTSTSHLDMSTWLNSTISSKRDAQLSMPPDSSMGLHSQRKSRRIVTSQKEGLLEDPTISQPRSLPEYANLSSVDYIACCGLGHKLTKLSEAYYVANMFNFGLRVFWGFCDQIEVFSYLFGDPKPEDLDHVTSTDKVIRFNNEVSGFKGFKRMGPNHKCRCNQTKIESDNAFYRKLQNRFHLKEQVALFMLEHDFANHTVMGMHIRAGNNESGQFEAKNRGITSYVNDTEVWVDRIVAKILKLVGKHKMNKPLLYIATDTASFIGQFRSKLTERVLVLDLPQERAKEGEGVLFGEKGSVVNQGSRCLKGWDTAMMDMMILSHADIVLAARTSSFVQSMPFSMAFGRPPEERKVKDIVWCEFSPDGGEMKCFGDYMRWCCEGYTWFAFRKIQTMEYVRMPLKGVSTTNYSVESRPFDFERPSPAMGARYMFLPHAWSNALK